MQFAIENADKITVVSFQPVSFTGRDEDIADDERHAKRYTLSHLAHDLKSQLGATEPMRDWFPLSAMGPSATSPTSPCRGADWGALHCGCHPNCGIGTALLVHKGTKEMVPLARVPRSRGPPRRHPRNHRRRRSRAPSPRRARLALCRRFDARRAPTGFDPGHAAAPVPQPDGRARQRVGKYAGTPKSSSGASSSSPGCGFRISSTTTSVARRCASSHMAPGGRDQLLRVQHGRRMAADRREDARHGDSRRLVPRKGRHPVYAKNQELSLPAGKGTVRLPIIG